MAKQPLKIDEYATIRDHLLAHVDGHVRSLQAFRKLADKSTNDYTAGQIKYHKHAISALTDAIKTAKQRIAKGSYDGR